MFGLGASELLIILVIVVLLFGASKIPELGKSLGSGLKNFKEGLRQEDQPPPSRSALNDGRAAPTQDASKGDEIKVEPRG